MAKLLTPLTWGGHAIDRTGSSGNFEARLSFTRADLDPIASQPSEPVMTELPGASPVFAFGQPKSRTIDLEILILPEEEIDDMDDSSKIQGLISDLKSWFRYQLGQQWLVAVDADGKQRRILAFPGTMTPLTARLWHIVLTAADGLWQGVDIVEDTEEVTTSGQTWDIVNPGESEAPMVLRFTAGDVSSSAVTKMQQTFVANRTDQEVFDYASETYPVELSEGGLTPDDDFRIFLNGFEEPYWIAGGSLFVNLHLRAGKSATLAADIDNAVTELLVDNLQGLNGWPGSGWFFIEDEPVQYSQRSRYSPGILTRRWPVAHSAGATLYWIEHILRVCHDGPTIDRPAAWDDLEPLISLGDSSNESQKWVNKFFPLETRRSRGWLRELTDDNTGLVRTHDDDPDLVMEDLPPAANKPPLSHLVMNFPVPMVGPLVLDYEVEPSMELICRATDTDGFESELFKKFWSQGPVTAASFSTIPLSKIELIGRVAAVTGEVDASSVVSVNLTPTSQSLSLENPLYDQVKSDWQSYLDSIAQEYATWQQTIRAANGGAGGSSSITAGTGIPGGITKYTNVTIPLKGYIHINLEKETKINGILLYLMGTGASEWSLYNADGGGPFKPLLEMTFPAGAAGERVASFDPPAVIPAGEYFLRPNSGGYAIGARSGRTKASIWYGFHDVPRERDQTHTFAYMNSASSYFQYNGSADVEAHVKTIDFSVNETSDVDVPAKDWMHVDHFEVTPIVAILSEETEPQSDAPTESGMKVSIDNVVAPLDPAQSPKVWAAAAQDVLLIEGRLANETTGRYVDIVYPLPLTQSAELDTETARFTDLETMESMIFAAGFSHSAAAAGLLQAAPGTNTLSLTQDGVQSLSIRSRFAGRYQ